MTGLDARGILDRRLAGLGLSDPRFDSPEAVVGWLGAVQSQDFGPAKWSIAQRMDHVVTDADLDAAFDAGRILRTHALRPTWHFVRPEDIRWILELTGPRIQALSAYMYRTTGLTEELRARSNEIIADALAGGRALTRAALRARLVGEGLDTDGFRMGYLMMHAEVTGLVCSGPLDGRTHTYALLDERAPQAVRLSRDDALAEFVLRYFTSHGPASAKDFRAWCSLSAADTTRGLELAGAALEHEDWQGTTMWAGAGARERAASGIPVDPSPTVRLMQGYDESFMGYSDTRGVVDTDGMAGRSVADRAIYVGVLTLDGRFAGHWKRTIERGRVLIDAQLRRPFDEAALAALHTEADRHGRFMGLPAAVALHELGPD
jgi:hypothetical protein